MFTIRYLLPATFKTTPTGDLIELRRDTMQIHFPTRAYGRPRYNSVRLRPVYLRAAPVWAAE